MAGPFEGEVKVNTRLRKQQLYTELPPAASMPACHVKITELPPMLGQCCPPGKCSRGQEVTSCSKPVLPVLKSPYLRSLTSQVRDLEHARALCAGHMHADKESNTACRWLIIRIICFNAACTKPLRRLQRPFMQMSMLCSLLLQSIQIAEVISLMRHALPSRLLSFYASPSAWFAASSLESRQPCQMRAVLDKRATHQPSMTKHIWL